jgi:hypothetical protein
MAEQKHKTIELPTLAGGAAIELFDSAVAQVLENLQDPNTDWKARRKITLDVVFSSDEERQVGDIEIKCSTKLAGIKGVRTVVFYGDLNGRRVAVEQPRQDEMFAGSGRAPVLVRPENGA